MLLFGEVHEGTLDIYNGIRLREKSEIKPFIRGVIKRKKSTSDLLAFSIRYACHPEPQIQTFALGLLQNASYAEWRAAMKKAPAGEIIQWLRLKKKGYHPVGYYARMLGHCSPDLNVAEPLFLKTIDKANQSTDAMIGYIVASPQRGYQFLRGIASDTKKKFNLRYAVLRACRFLFDRRPDLIARRDLLAIVHELMTNSNIADLAIEELRRRKDWKHTVDVLAIADDKEFDIPIIHRAILRFALCSPTEDAKSFVQKMRQTDAEAVSEMEKLLKSERSQPK